MIKLLTKDQSAGVNLRGVPPSLDFSKCNKHRQETDRIRCLTLLRIQIYENIEYLSLTVLLKIFNRLQSDFLDHEKNEASGKDHPPGE